MSSPIWPVLALSLIDAIRRQVAEMTTETNSGKRAASSALATVDLEELERLIRRNT